MNATRRWGAVAVVGACVVAGCTGGDDPSPTTFEQAVVTTSVPPSASSAVEVPDLAASYFDAVAAGRPVAETVAVPGSDADRFAQFRSAATRLLADGAGPVGATPTVSTTPTAIDVCDPDCTSYSLVTVEAATGRIETFAVDDVPLVGRIVGDGLRADDDGVIGLIETAFRNQAGDVLAVIEIRNTTDVAVDLFGFSAVYQPAGAWASREATGWWGADAFDPGIGGSMLIAFDAPDAPPVDEDRSLGSGRISISGLRSDGVPIALDLTLPRAGG